MYFEPALIVALGVLTLYAARHSHVHAPAEASFAAAPTAEDGALRIARTRLVRGEIDFAEYRRIEAVLRG